MPTEEAVICERRLEVLSGIERHLDDALDLSPWLGKTRNIEPQPQGDRRTDLFGVQGLPFNRRGVHHFTCQHREVRLCTKVEAQGLHLSEMLPLLVAHRGKGRSESIAIP
jgi:hypothetical protein